MSKSLATIELLACCFVTQALAQSIVDGAALCQCMSPVLMKTSVDSIAGSL